MKFAHAHASKTKTENELVVAFFFNARGEALEKSTIGMYRALLFELMQKAPDLQNILDDSIPVLVAENPDLTTTNQLSPDTWTVELLQKLLSAAINRLGQRTLKCFVDALDECDEEQIREMVSFFEELGSITDAIHLYICFASRHYPTIDVRNGQKLNLEDECGHMEDLSKYVRNHLHAGRGKYIDEIRAEILEKSNGVFMWAVLVVDILNKEFRRGRIFAVRQRLLDIPTQLSTLFKDILRRDCENMDDLLLCLQWVLYAKRPLRREEFYFAMIAALDPDNLSEWNPEYVTIDDMNRFVVSSSKGLAELTKSKTPTVQFIHESVRDFLIRDGGLCELWPETAENVHSISHDKLKRCCQKYISIDISAYLPPNGTPPIASSESAKQLRQEIKSKFPFLEYASRCVLYHADEAARNISQHEFLRGFSIDHWVRISNIFEFFNTRCHSTQVTFLYIFAECNYVRLIETVGLGAFDTNTGEHYPFPFFAALANNHREAVQVLLQRNNDVNSDEIIARLKFGRTNTPRKVVTPLLWALEEGHDSLAVALLISVRENCLTPTTHLQSYDLEASNSSKMTALLLAVSEGKEPIVRLLLEQQANVEAKTRSGMTALLLATRRRDERVMKLYLDRDANIEVKDSSGRTALSLAMVDGDEQPKELSSHENVDVRASHKPGTKSSSPSHLIVQLLLDRGADLEARDDSDMTALLRAAMYGQEVIVQLLLNYKADIEARDYSSKTALLLATEHSQEAVVQLLLDRGADLEARDNFGKTALLYAAKFGWKAIVQLLLDRGADLEARDDFGKTALLYAAKFGWDTIVRLILEEQFDRQMLERNGRSPTEQSTESDCHKVVRLLLSQDNGTSRNAEETVMPFPWLGECLWRYSTMRSDAYALERRKNLALLDCKIDSKPLEQQSKKRLMMTRLGRHISVEESLIKRIEEVTKSASTNLNNIDVTDEHKIAAVTAIAGIGSRKLLTFLITDDIDVDNIDSMGRTALIYAAAFDKASIVQFLVDDKKASVDATDQRGMTALIWAALKGHTAIVQMLLDRNANIEARDHNLGGTALLLAVCSRQTTTVKLLLENGACVEAMDNNNNTALAYALASARKVGIVDIVTILMKHGADCMAQNRHGQTPVGYAARYRMKRELQMMLANITNDNT